MHGRVVAVLEARRSSELAGLIQTYQGVPRSAPALREEPVADLGAIGAFLDRIATTPMHLMLFQTGVGTRALFAGVDSIGRGPEFHSAIESATVAVRGPKPTAALRELGIRIDHRAAEPYTTSELLASFADLDLSGKIVGLQQYGESNVELLMLLRARGATVCDVEVYRWALPEDTSPLEGLIRDLPSGGIDALIVTSQVQVRHLFQVAEGIGVIPKDLRRHLARIFVAAVGPVAARALRDFGVQVDLEPAHPKMGSLVRELAEHFETSAPATTGKEIAHAS